MLTHVSIHLFPMIMLFIIYVNNHKKVSKDPDKVLFDVLTLLALAFMGTETIVFGLAGMLGSSARLGLWIFYIIYTLLVPYIAGIWFVYVGCRLKVWNLQEQGRRILYTISGLLLILTVLVVTTPGTQLAFSLTEANRYRAGIFSFLSYLVSGLFYLASIWLTLRVGRTETTTERKAESRYLLGCGIPQLAGLVLHYFFHEFWVGAPCLSLTILFIYLNAQNRQITTDELTGLNNRRELEQQLIKKMEQERDGSLGMLMLDINDFKKINDTLGHAVGDEALWETADILRRIFGKQRTFLARYGGDEFAVIGEWADAQEACAAIAAVEAETVRFNREEGKKYTLSFSIGYALYTEADSPEMLVKKADERMYAEKAHKKK